MDDDVERVNEDVSQAWGGGRGGRSGGTQLFFQVRLGRERE